MKVVETSRLLLRLISLSDLENLYHLLYADPEVAIPWTGHVQSLREVSAPNGLLSRVSRATGEPGLLGRGQREVLVGLAVDGEGAAGLQRVMSGDGHGQSPSMHEQEASGSWNRGRSARRPGKDV